MTSGSFCVIRDTSKRVLLCHRRDKDLWNLPGGLIEEGESPWDAAVREAREEIGVEVHIKSLIGCYFKEKENDLVFMFECTIPDDIKPLLSGEADEVEYFSLSRLPDNTAPKQRERLMSCFVDISKWPIFTNQ